MQKNYPLIILGAGASFDSISKKVLPQLEIEGYNYKNCCPPLTNDLFNRKNFGKLIDNHISARRFEQEIYRLEENQQLSFEDLTTEILLTRAPKNKVWYESLIDLRLYLHDLFRYISLNHFTTRSNHGKLASLLDRHHSNHAIFVNFNYDLLLEKQFDPGIKFEHIEDYISSDLKIIKIHGACNWFKQLILENDIQAHHDANKYILSAAQSLITNESNEKNTAEIVISDKSGAYSIPINNRLVYFMPNISLPINQKIDYVCPTSHIEIFKKEINNIDRVIIIGWKAADEYLLKLLSDNLRDKNIPIFIACHNSSEEVAKRLKEKYNLWSIPLNQGFSDFIESGKCEEILTATNFDIYKS